MTIKPKPRRRRKGAGRIAFLAQLEPIRKLIGEGWPLMSIYDELEAKLDIGYPQFTRYVKRYVTEGAPDGHQKEGGSRTAAAPQAGSGTQPRQRPTPKPTEGFRHDPQGGNRDDLI